MYSNNIRRWCRECLIWWTATERPMRRWRQRRMSSMNCGRRRRTIWERHKWYFCSSLLSLSLLSLSFPPLFLPIALPPWILIFIPSAQARTRKSAGGGKDEDRTWEDEYRERESCSWNKNQTHWRAKWDAHILLKCLNFTEYCYFCVFRALYWTRVTAAQREGQ